MTWVTFILFTDIPVVQGLAIVNTVQKCLEIENPLKTFQFKLYVYQNLKVTKKFSVFPEPLSFCLTFTKNL